MLEETVEKMEAIKPKSKKHRLIDDDKTTDDPNTKKTRTFSAKEFRISLSDANKTIALENFKQILKNDDQQQDHISDYLESGGSLLELLQTLETDSSIPPYLVFDIINLILLKIIANHPKHQSPSLETCRYLLTNFMPVVNKMLNLSSSGQERLSVLKLLTTMITFSSSLAKEILLNVIFYETNLELLTKHTIERNKVRKVFIQFITAFLVDGSFSILRLMVDKKGMFNSILSGLKYDDADTVCMVVTAMKNYILENPVVSKTLKMKVFNTLVVRDVVSLYNWKGPAGFKASQQKVAVAVEVDEYEKSKVSESVHNFLLILCTSHKQGIIFRDSTLGLGKKSQNALMYTVLQSLERPWEHSYASQLVTQICIACPDLAKTMWANLKSFFEVRLTKKWPSAIHFAKILLKQLDSKSIEFCVREVSVNQLCQAITILVAPLPILKVIIPASGQFEFEDFTLKKSVVEILLEMLRAIEEHLSAAKLYLSQDDYQKLKHYLTNYVARNFVDAKLMLQNWETNSSSELSDYLHAVLDIFEHYKRVAPQLLDGINFAEINVQEFLQKIEQNCTENVVDLQIKLIKVFIDFDQSQFQPNTALFKFVMPLLLNYYYNSKQDAFVLTRLLSNTGIFEGCDYEIHIWLNGFLNLKSWDQEFAKFFCEMLQLTAENIFQYLELLNELQGDDNLNAVDMLVDSNRLCEAPAPYNRRKYLSPLIIGFLQKDCDDKSYLPFVVVNLLHMQDNSQVLRNILIKLNAKLPKNVLNYVESWTLKREVCSLKLKGKLQFQSLSESFLDGDVKDFVVENESVRLDFLQMCIYYFGNLIELQVANEKHAQNCEKFVKSCIDVRGSHEIILANRLMLSQFSLLKDNLATNFITNVVKSVQTQDVEVYVKIYRAKIMKTLVKILKKPHKYTNIKNITEILNLFGLEYNQIVELITILNCEKTSIIVFEVIVYCLKKLSSYNQPLSDENTKTLNDYLAILNQKQEINTSSYSLALKEYLEEFPHQIVSFNETLFNSIFNMSELSKENVLLCTFLLQRNITRFLTCIEANLDVICEKKAVILPVLAVLTQKTDISEELLLKIYGKLEQAIVKALQKPQKAGQSFMQSYDGVVVLLEKFLPVEKCEVYAEKVQKFEVSETFHAKMLQTIFNKLLTPTILPKKINNIVLIYVHLLINLFKRQKCEKLGEVAMVFDEVLTKITELQLQDQDLSTISNNETFKLCCKFCLKFGVAGESIYLRILVKLVRILNVKSLAMVEAKLLLEMLWSHSELLEQLLGANEEVKEAILKLFLAICENWKDLMERSHLPVLLSAYKAMVTRSDRLILKLLKLYESNADKTKFYDFKPVLWDHAAATHYSVHSNMENRLWRQPRMGDVLDILNHKHILSTIRNYPLEDDTLTIPNPNPDLKHPVYDLAFLLPLFSQLLSAENRVQTYFFTQSGALALTIIGLSNPNKETRQAACHVLARFHFHMEARQFGKDNLIWIRFIEAICKGTAILPDCKLNNFTAIFLARMSLIITQPNHVMYLPLTNYLGIKSEPDFSTIPELYTFIHSCDLNFKEHRLFILQVLRDGVRTKHDFAVLMHSWAFKLFSELYASSVSDLETKLLILDILQNICKIPNAALTLCRKHSLLTQLYSSIINMFEFATKNERKELDQFVDKFVKILKEVLVQVVDRSTNVLVYGMLRRILLENEVRCFNIEFYEAFYLIEGRFPDVLESDCCNVLVGKSDDKFCKYLNENGGRFVDEGCLGDESSRFYYLRKLVYSRFK